MRTTLNLDADVLDRARKAAERSQLPFREVVNEALREGLGAFEQTLAARPYRTIPHRMGLKDGYSLDSVQELLSRVEGDEHW